MFGAHMGPVTAFGAGIRHDEHACRDSLAALAIAVATPLCTVPIEHIDVVALDELVDVVGRLGEGSDSSSTFTNSISRPASLPPCSVDVELEAVLDGRAQLRRRCRS
jgi:hypothetical protein